MNNSVNQALEISKETPTEFFCKCWEDVIRNTENGNADSAVLNSPRFILKRILDEIKYNDKGDRPNIIKKDIREYNNLCKKYPFFDKITSKENEDEKLEEEIIKIRNTDLIDKICSCAIEEVNNHSHLSFDFKENIEELIKLIICEFICKEFEISSLSQLPKHPKSIITNDFGNVIISPSSFEGIDSRNFESDEEYKKSLSTYLSNRDISQRINTICEYYHSEIELFTVCYRVMGLTGEIDTSIGSVHLSSKIPNYNKGPVELSKRRNYIYATINVKAEKPDVAIIKGLHSIETIVGLLTIKMQPTKPFIVSVNNAIVFQDNELCVDRNENSLDNGITDKDNYKLVDITYYAKHLEAFRLDRYESIIDRFTELNRTLYYYNKARNSKESSDKLLFSWMAVENIFMEHMQQKRKSAKEIIPVKCAYIITPHIYYTKWYLLYDHIRDCIDRKQISIPLELRERSGLNVKIGQQINKEAFIKELQCIENNIKDEKLKTEIRKTVNLYLDTENIEKQKKEIINDLCQVCNIRNLMVHNAFFDKNTIDVYANKSFEYCTCVLNGVLHTINANTEQSTLYSIIDFFDKENHRKYKDISNEIKKRKEQFESFNQG